VFFRHEIGYHKGVVAKCDYVDCRGLGGGGAIVSNYFHR